jgi:hypothetical protein
LALFGSAARREDGDLDFADWADLRGFTRIFSGLAATCLIFRDWTPPSAGRYCFDYDFNMIYMMVMITTQLNHSHHINHIKIIVRITVKQVAARPLKIRVNPPNPQNPGPRPPYERRSRTKPTVKKSKISHRIWKSKIK